MGAILSKVACFNKEGMAGQAGSGAEHRCIAEEWERRF